jgi:hypothetical protein
MSSRLLGILDLVLNKIHVLELMRRICGVHVGMLNNRLQYSSLPSTLSHFTFQIMSQLP